jgi:hypothetical protein
MRGHLPIADQRCSLRAIKISLTCGLAFIICFLQKIIADARFAPKLRVRKFEQASTLPVFAANRSPAVRGTVLICGVYQWSQQPRNVLRSGEKEDELKAFGPDDAAL